MVILDPGRNAFQYPLLGAYQEFCGIVNGIGGVLRKCYVINNIPGIEYES